LKASHGDYAERFASAEAMADHPRMRVSDIEAQLGLTYTIDVLKVLQDRAIGADFVWLMGSDAAAGFHHWKDWQAIISNIPVAIVSRSQSDADGRYSRFASTWAEARYPPEMAGLLTGAEPPAWTWLNASLHPASSTAIRNRITTVAGKR
jgi:nicotinate-nucleotide adenylyltransferase